jgi:aminopeptidase N
MRTDPHSHTDLDQGRVTDLALAWTVDFERRVLHGHATLTLDDAATGPLDLDTRGLDIDRVVGGDGAALPFTLGATDPVLGQRLRVQRDRATSTLTVHYQTSPDASALMWLDPSQTDGGAHPFLLTQCQAIHARSLVPVQDSPQVRIRYSARVSVPAPMSAVMSAAPGTQEVGAGAWRTLRFEMPQPIPAYLLALAVGQLESRDLGPRTRVFAEPGVVESAAWEFADAERMLEAAEGLFGPYAWERYDFIVLPPSFPMGGMENPRMTFLTPTLLAGDRSLVSVLAHELAHSWTGNLVTNATNADFWLNEGWTVYAERRILEVLYGAEAAAQDARLGRVALDEALAERRASGRSTALCYDQEGLDPDVEFSKVPYERGFLLITALEQAVGRPAFDVFIQQYMERYRFHSLTTAGFLDFVRERLPGATEAVDLDAWVYGEALPADAPTFESPRLTALAALARGWPTDDRPDPGDWSTTEALFFLSQLPHLDAGAAEAVGDWLGLRDTGNAELQCAWLSLAAASGVEGLEPECRAFVDRVGRTKLLKPVLSAMVGQDTLRPVAEALVASNRERWHGSTRLVVDSILGAS